MTIITPDKIMEEMNEGIRLLEIGLEKVVGLKNNLIQLIKEIDNSELLNDAESCYDELLITEKANGFMRQEIWQWKNQLERNDAFVENVAEEKITILEKIITDLSLMDALQENLAAMLNSLWQRRIGPAS